MNNKKVSSEKFLVLTLAWIVSGCSSASTQPNEERPGESSSSSQKTLTLLTSLNDRIQTLESKLNSTLTRMNDKIDSVHLSLDHLAMQKKTPSTAVFTAPSEHSGTSVSVIPVANDPEIGFINDESVQNFRKAIILYEGQKYPESVLTFSSFLEKAPDHPLAGSAQFYIGEAYMKQKEYRLALQEFQRVLTSYDRSAHIADTLSEMATAEEKLKNHPEAQKHRQLLTSLFPQSPAAANLAKKIQTEKPSEGLEHPTPPLPLEATPIEDGASSLIQTPPTAPVEDQNKLTPSESASPEPREAIQPRQ